MTHVRELIHRSLDEQLSAQESARLDAHLSACDSCRALRIELRRNDALLATREPLPGVPVRRTVPGPRFTFAPAVITLATIVLALVVGSKLADLRGSGVAQAPPRGDFAPFVMTIEQFNPQRIGLPDGRKLAGTTVYRLEYQDRQNWVMTIVADEVPDRSQVPGSMPVEYALGSGNACRDGVYGHIESMGVFRPGSTDPALCNGVGRWIHYGTAEGYPWAKQVSGARVTYTSPGERVVFDLTTGLPVLYESGVGSATTYRETFTVEWYGAPLAAKPDPASVGVCARTRQRVLGMTALVHRADRVEVKRMSAQDFMDAPTGAFPVQVTWRSPGSTFLCVVAVSGELRQPSGQVEPAPPKWAVFVAVAGSDDPIGSQFSSSGDWPAYFDALPDRRGEPYPGDVVEIIDPQTVRVKLWSPMLSQEFGNPTTLRADKFTAITPSAPTIAATGVKVGDWVGVFFEREGRDPTSGAYPLSIFQLRAVPPVAANSGVLEVDGWRFTVSVVRDPAYGPKPSAGAWAVSEVAGIGVRCAWTRTGPDAGTADDQWGIPERVVPTARYSGRTGESGDRQNGIPEGAVRGNAATMVCGLRDGAGAQGVLIDLTVPSAGRDASIRLSRWSGSLRPPQCSGQLPQLVVAHAPPPGDQPGTGAPSAEEAFRRAYPAITEFTMYPFGTDQPTRDPQVIKQGPAWIVAGSDTFIALYIGPSGLNSWFAHPAKFVRCMDPPSRPSPTPTISPTDCNAVVQAVVPPTATLYPTRTAAEVTGGLKNDPYFRHTLEDIAGVRQDPNPLRDRGVPRCAVDALTTGDPVFVRRYPSNAGVWYVPVNYPDRQVLLVTVSRNEAGLGASGGSIGGGGDPGGAFPPMIRAKAMQLTGTSTDAAVSAELVFARAYGSDPKMVAWRIVRASGAVFYVFPGYPGAGTDGLLLPASQVSLGS